MPPMKLVLPVEDDPERAREIQACILPGFRCVWAKSAGAACGILRRDKFAAILLDFDLHRGALGNPAFTGETAAETACETQDRTCQIFVHSQHATGSRGLVMKQRPET